MKILSKPFVFFSILIYYSFREFIIEYFFPNLDYTERIIQAGVDLFVILLGVSYFFTGKISFINKIFILLIFFSTLTFVYNSDQVDIATHLNGLREPFIFLSSLIILENIFKTEDRKKITKHFTYFFIIFLILQIPTVVLQFSIHGAGDYVGGTFGSGGSGILTLLIFSIIFYLILNYASTHNYNIFNIKKVLIISLLLIPVFLNETKISFVLIIVYFLMQINLKKYVFRSLLIVFIGALSFLFFSKVYVETRTKYINPTDFLSIDFINYYFFTPDNHSTISRISKIKLYYELISDDFCKVLLGSGYGITKGQNVLGTTQIGENLRYLYRGSKILLFETFFQGGIFFIFIIFTANFYFLLKKPSVSEFPNETRLRIFLIFIFLIIWIYNCSLLNRASALIYSYLMIWLNYGGVKPEKLSSPNSTTKAQ